MDEKSLTFHYSQHVGRHSSLLSHHKGSYQGCFGTLGAKGQPLLQPFGCVERGVAQKRILFLGLLAMLRTTSMSKIKVYEK